jgi:uncharacterized protein with beta-barrel porin domain
MLPAPAYPAPLWRKSAAAPKARIATHAGTGRDLALVGFGASYATSRNLTLFARYDAQLGKRVGDHAVSAGIKMSW